MLIAKTTEWRRLKELDTDLQFETVEAARLLPITSRAVVKAPVSGFNDGTRNGLYFINRYGAFVQTGLHVDSLSNSSRGGYVSDDVNWWSPDAVPRLDTDNIGAAVGEYWPKRNWVLWAAPMILPGTDRQTQNNRVIIFDLSLRCWLPPFSISAASLCLAYSHHEASPGKLGDSILLAGDYSGKILRLFDPQADSDSGALINGFAETGWLAFGAPDLTKLLRSITVHGKASGPVSVELFTDGRLDNPLIIIFDCLTDDSDGLFGAKRESLNLMGRFFKIRLTTHGPASIYGLQLETASVRDR